ncbi:MAG TPA: DUF1801 domain-containing protein [Dehalococcoidia bacterium]|nr:DUF1801 domain-containing protein [Dehalococcoidia bacterium]
MTAKTVDEYIASAPDESRATLSQLRGAIKEAAPAAEEVISYQMPTYKLDGHLVAFGAWTKHCGFYVMSTTLLEAHREEVKPYAAEKSTLHFGFHEPVPTGLVQKLVKARVAENKAAREAKQAGKRQKG